MSLDSLYAAIQENCPPGIWSRGVALARQNAVTTDRVSKDEIVLRVVVRDRPVHPRVTLWPEDADWYCDCGDRNDPCFHIAAAVIALKLAAEGQLVPASSEKAAENSPRAHASRVIYRFFREGRSLSLRRFVVSPGKTGEIMTPLNQTLVSFVGGVQSGRIALPAIAATRDDFAADAALGPSPTAGPVPESAMPRLLAALENIPDVTLDGQPVRASRKALRYQARLRDAPDGFRLEVLLETEAEIFGNGAALCDSLLRPLSAPGVSAGARIFPRSEVPALLEQVLPELSRHLDLKIETSRLPSLESIPPRLEIRAVETPDGALAVIPSILYGDPPIAEIRADETSNGTLVSLSDRSLPIRDEAAERALTRELMAEFHVAPGRMTRFEGFEALRFAERLDHLRVQAAYRVTGQGLSRFRPRGELTPELKLTSDASPRFEVQFSGPEGAKGAPSEAVFRAWRANEPFVRLLDGSWSRLPQDWLQRFGSRVERLLAARARSEGTGDGSARTVPAFLLPETLRLFTEAGQSLPENLENLRERFDCFTGIPKVELPRDLTADLRPYQRDGIDWLCFLRDSSLGALLADDMGLGKTLEAICSFRGRTLVVAPTSVLHSWKEQLARFRPGLSAGLYHGSDRSIDPHVDVVITSYGTLRMDASKLLEVAWDTVVLDEAQTIKNPDSQIARLCHRLRSGFRLALSGTPIENRLEDLWSQFEFLNPGLLGSLGEFQDRASTPAGVAELRERLKPFILRRLKKEVARELPPRTEIVLRCELSGDERELYQSLLAGARREILAKLDTGTGKVPGVFAVLELLLRLRQACCHPALVPGATANGSSKLDLLLDTLGESLDLGHRALVFSQWTSYLDLIGAALERRGFTYSRLDGSTRDRDEVVTRFQKPDGPSIMLISLKAGGLGLTLTAADHVYIMDPWWNPAAEDQAADRAHRIGQQNPVLVHRLIAQDTIEERVLDLQRRKQELAASMLEGAEGATAITREDLMALLA